MVPDADTQSLFQLGAAGDIFQHGGSHILVGITSRSLRDIEGNIRVFDKLLRLSNVLRQADRA